MYVSEHKWALTVDSSSALKAKNNGETEVYVMYSKTEGTFEGFHKIE